MIERDPTPMPARRGTGGGRRWLIAALAILAVLVLSLRGISSFWIDYLWFDSVGFSSVWTTAILTRVVLVLIATVVAAALLYGNLVLADRLSPKLAMSTGTPDEELIERFQLWVRPRINLLRLAVAGFFGLLIGLGAGAWWEDWLLFRHGENFGVTDPVFNNDIGMYVFKIPFYRDLFSWGFQFVLITTLIVAALHYLNGGIRLQSSTRERLHSGVKVHLSVLVAILVLLKAVAYWLDQFDLLYSSRGFVAGASYTDVTAQLPALRLLIFISLFAAILLLVNIRFRGWILPAAAIGLWAVTSFVVGFIIPEAIQRFSVEPDEISKELPYIERNIEFTRQAFGLDGIEIRAFEASLDLDSTGIAANAPIIDNIRLWDPTVLLTTYRQLQELRPFYQFDDVDVDRYSLDGELTQVMLAARELDATGVPEDNWVNQHLVYTHGYGAVVSPANSVTAEGQPDFLVRDINPEDGAPEAVQIDQPRIYFGDAPDLGDFVIVGSKEQEVDFPVESAGAETVSFNSYDGAGGIRIGGFFRQVAFALRFADINTLISGQITPDSRVLLVRNIRERFAKAAPFLRIDADPYLAIVDGRLVWIVDMYTVTNRYPYSSSGDTSRLAEGSALLGSGFNYIRNSVKGTVDAYDGTMILYVIDETDAVVRSYRNIFPTLFTDGAQMSDDLRSHLRYPEDLFRIQSNMYSRYHMVEPRVFFNNGDPWQIARDPSTILGDAATGGRLMNPYYLLTTLPGEEDLSYLLLQPFTAADRPNMVSFLVAKSDPGAYGEIVNFELPRDSFVDGPGQIGARINQDPEISKEFTLLGQEGSDVVQGNLLVVPIETSVVYVQPIYIRGSSAEAALPEFKRVVVVYGSRIVMRDTLASALTAVFGDAPPPVVEPGEEPTTPPGTGVEVDAQVVELLTQAEAAFERADAALRAGDLGAYADEVAEAQRLIQEATALIEGS
ncbi:MAG: UPF0182 family protein [Actinobacteria bacterium]|nr:UPF0182 family protein [Actinomycetota bacterium]